MSEEEPRPAPDRPRPGAPAPRDIPADDIDEALLDQNALRVISRLHRQGFEAYLVGGCVRDLLVGRRPKDFDVATSAHPRQIKRLFRNGRIIGRRFRLVHIYYGQRIVETATFRSEPRTEEGDEDDLLIVEDNEYGTAAEDARRRDFTVNGLFLDPMAGRILDYVGGLEDLDARLLRTIGDPHVRMAEDPVRILRAIKFATRLGLRIEEQTWAAMREVAPELERSAPPRVLEEILRLLRSGTALGAFRMMRRCGVLAVVLPRIAEYLGPAGGLEGGGAVDEAALRRAEVFWRLLEALDTDVHDGSELSTGLCVALLFLPVVELEQERRAAAGRRAELAHVASEVLEDVAVRTRLSRRDSGRARRIIVAQARFEAPQPSGADRSPQPRRSQPLRFLRGEDFPDALELFRLRVVAHGQGWDLYEGWRERHRRALQATPEDLEEERRQARRGRRRRRRRRRRPGSGDDGPARGDDGD